MDYSPELTDAQPPNTEAVFQSVTEELQEMKHKYETEMLRVLEDQERAQEELTTLRQQQNKMMEQNEECRRARQQELLALEKKFKAAQSRIYEQMRVENDAFTQLQDQTAHQLESIDAILQKAVRRQTKLEKRRDLILERETHVRKLQAEYRANIAQLSQSYATAAVEKVNPNSFRADVKDSSLNGSSTSNFRDSLSRERPRESHERDQRSLRGSRRDY